MKSKLTEILLFAFMCTICVVAGLFIYDRIEKKTPVGLTPESQHKMDSLQNEINKREVRLGIMDTMYSLLKINYTGLESQKTPVRNTIIQKQKQYTALTQTQKDSAFYKKYYEYYPR